MWSRLRVVFAGIFLLSGLASSSWGQDEVIRVNTSLIKVPVTVLDRDGRYVVDAKRESFRIFEAGLEQEIVSFETSVQPFTALLLFDNSGSMNGYLDKMMSAAISFVDQMRNEDVVILGSFADERVIKILGGPTKKVHFVKDFRFNERTGDGFTATFDAVENGLKYLEKFSGRKALVLFSDGEMYGKKASLKSNIRAAEESEVLIYPIQFGDFPSHQPGVRVPDVPRTDSFGTFGDRDSLGNTEIIKRTDLDTLTYQNNKKFAKLRIDVESYFSELSTRTGGRRYKIDRIAELSTSFRQVALELGQQYLLGYSASKPGANGEKRSIRVRVDIPNTAVRSRTEIVYGNRK